MNENQSRELREFDPYRTWLGLETTARPPDHYELLGLSRFESNSTLISNAVERQTAILQMVTGADQELVRSILADIGQARGCLLDPERKSIYDHQLGESLAAGNSGDSTNATDQGVGVGKGHVENGVQEPGPSSKDVTNSEDQPGHDDLKQIQTDAGGSAPAEFTGADITGADITGADIIGADTDDAPANSPGEIEAESSRGEKNRTGETEAVGSFSIQVDGHKGNSGRGLNEHDNITSDPIVIDTGDKKEPSAVPPQLPNSDSSKPESAKTDSTPASIVPPLESTAEPPSNLETESKKSNSEHQGTEETGVVTNRESLVISPAPESQDNQEQQSDVGLSALESDLHSARVESQKAKEAQDQKFKVIMDKLLWASCGVAMVAIIWVMIVRISGCNRDPVQIVADENSDSQVKSQKLAAGKDLDLSLKSPLEKSAKALLNQQQKKAKGDQANQRKQNGNRPSKQSDKKSPTSSPGGSPSNDRKDSIPEFQSIKETIGFFDFNEPVNGSDLLAALAPLRLKKIKWNKQGQGGYISLSDKSDVFVDRDDAFDTLNELSFVCRFRCSKDKETRYLASFKQLFVIAIKNGSLRFGPVKKLSAQSFGKNLSDGKWHQLAVRLNADQTLIWLDGKEQGSLEIPFPRFKSSSHATTFGKLDDAAAAGIQTVKPFVGAFDNLGFYWIQLSERQIKSQLAR